MSTEAKLHFKVVCIFGIDLVIASRSFSIGRGSEARVIWGWKLGYDSFERDDLGAFCRIFMINSSLHAIGASGTIHNDKPVGGDISPGNQMTDNMSTHSF